MTSSERALVGVAWIALACGCGEERPTEIVLIVDTPLVPGFDLDRIAVETTGPSGLMETFEAPLDGDGALSLPLSLALVAGGPRLEPVEVRVRALAFGFPTPYRQTVRTSFVSGQSRMLYVVLWPNCFDDTCEGTCDVNGTCGPADIPGSSLPRFDGVPGRVRDPCIPPPGDPRATVGCNGGVVPPASDDRYYGNCDVAMLGLACSDGSFCVGEPTAPTGVCLYGCDRSDEPISRSNCPPGSRCFSYEGQPFGTCFQDCRDGLDCSSGVCDAEGSCVWADPPDAGT